MKRGREDEQTLDLVSCLMLLSKVGQNDSSPIKKQKTLDRAFVCKTCNREFSSFQALGGHRASHNKPKLMAGNGASDLLQLAQSSPSSPAKPKTHECPICGLEFAIGQALGGHMRRHRDVMTSAAADRVRAAAVPVLKKSTSSKWVSCLDLDLNLAPPGYQRHYDLTKLQLIS
ncbi:zinc finger protein ZAT12-like [Rosa sericea]